MPRPLHVFREPDDIDARIERACRFIEKAVDSHERRLGVEVGEYLFVHVYDRDLKYIFRNDPRKDRSLRDISAATSVSLKSLSRWLKAAAVRRRLALLGIDANLGLQKLEAIYKIEDVNALRALVEWAGGVPTAQVKELVRRWTEHLDQGGDPADLLGEPLPLPKPKPRKRTRTGEELIVPRLLTLMLEWARKHRLSPRLRERLLGDLVALRRRIGRRAR
ncbi:MAG: hypothetical protein JRG91_20525 [Deltaproteobacteria bacterium]|nr:hypothetical protein [Deltaproteobacteria bacterium]